MNNRNSPGQQSGGGKLNVNHLKVGILRSAQQVRWVLCRTKEIITERINLAQAGGVDGNPAARTRNEPAAKPFQRAKYKLNVGKVQDDKAHQPLEISEIPKSPSSMRNWFQRRTWQNSYRDSQTGARYPGFSVTLVESTDYRRVEAKSRDDRRRRKALDQRRKKRQLRPKPDRKDMNDARLDRVINSVMRKINSQEKMEHKPRQRQPRGRGGIREATQKELAPTDTNLREMYGTSL